MMMKCESMTNSYAKNFVSRKHLNAVSVSGLLFDHSQNRQATV